MAEVQKPSEASTKSAAEDAASEKTVQASQKAIAEAEQKLIDDARKTIDEALKAHPHSDGLGDNVSGDASESFEDHVTSNDPAKKAFPPGPDDPSKVVG